MSKLSRFVAVTTLCLSTVSVASAASKILLIVNKDPVTEHDLDQRVKLMVFSSGGQMKIGEAQRSEILRSIVQEKLQIQAAKLRKIDVSAKEVDAVLKDMAKDNNMSYDQLISLLKSNGIDKQTMVSRIRAQIAWARYIRQQYAPVVYVSEAEAEKQLAKLSLDQTTKQYNLGEIVVLGDDAQALASIKSILTDLKSGAKFEAIAHQLSKSASAAKDGDLGWLAETSLDASVLEKIKEIGLGQISDPIKIAGGYKIVKLKDMRHAGTVSKDDVEISFTQAIFPITPQSSPEEIEALAPSIQRVMGAKNKSEFTTLANSYNADVQDTPHVRLAQMPDQLRGLLTSVSVGKCTQPVMTPNGLIITFICDKRQPQPIVHTKDDVMNNLEQERFGRQAAREIQKLMGSAHIDTKDESAKRMLKL
ncbi:MAG: peptidylprolyl isomerase [Candidatus Paracaedibacteraceae bacterium]|nr:peptidylprolyl isomerase [Candidatus Paracaedibacteraceae bacterium]